MILAVPMTEWSWLEDVIDPETLLPTGAKTREYGLFWNWLHANIDVSIITPSFTRLISETPKKMIKDGLEWGVEIMPVNRFNVPDYDAWATGMLTGAKTEGITILATTCTKAEKAQWFIDNGFTEPPE